MFIRADGIQTYVRGNHQVVARGWHIYIRAVQAIARRIYAPAAEAGSPVAVSSAGFACGSTMVDRSCAGAAGSAAVWGREAASTHASSSPKVISGERPAA
jgi:hypothetical protein